jgi:hypothetical protein
MIVVNLPLSQLEAAAAIDGVLLIDIPSGGSNRTDVTRKVTQASEVLNGTGEKPTRRSKLTSSSSTAQIITRMSMKPNLN